MTILTTSATLFEHEDGRYAVWPGTESPPWTQGDAKWHRVGPVDVSAFTLTAVPPAPTEQWMPIADAPQDGRTLLLGYFNSHGKWRTLRGQWMSEDYIAEYWEEPDGVEPGWFETVVEHDDIPNCWPTDPTHYQLLPSPPQGAAKGAKE